MCNHRIWLLICCLLKQFTLGVSSLSKLGPIGATVEIVLILYLIATSSIGLYALPVMDRIRPRVKSTPFSLIILNCSLVLLLSSALPVLSKTLGKNRQMQKCTKPQHYFYCVGITNFDLLGDFGSIEWLDNFVIVIVYNFVFAVVVTLTVLNKFTAKVRREVYARLVENYVFLSNCVSFLN